MDEAKARRHLGDIIEAIKKGEVEVRDIDLDKEVVVDANGERLTEERAQEIAESGILEHYRTAGRPSLTGPRQRSPQITFRIPKRLAERAEEVAAREGKSLSQLGREALEQYVEKAG